MLILTINILIALLVDILSFLTLTKRRIVKSANSILVLKIVHITFSIATYILIIRIALFKGEFADNRNIYNMMILGLLAVSVWFPRVIVITFSNISFWVGQKFIKTGKIILWAGNTLALLTIIMVVSGSLIGRFNFRYKEVEIKFDNLPPQLEGFKIVQLSDMHLSSFHKHSGKLRKVINRINSYNPDIIANTGDFVTIAWNEMVPFDHILAQSESRFGNFAIPGNHDAGTYHPFYTQAERADNVLKMDSLIKSAGYIQLKDTSIVLSIDSIRVKLAGVTTLGTIPNIVFGDIDKALGENMDEDFTLLLSHDPNHWYYELQERADINLTLSGHTHAMQLGISIGKLQWSPASLLYPAWSGLYGNSNNYLYVNRGLGTISFPFRIGMPPEITIITLAGN